MKTLLKIDDSMDVFAQHGVGGIIGLLANAFFASDVIISLDGVNVGLQNPTTGTLQGGFINHNYRQLYIQLAYIVVCCAYSFTVTALIAFLINLIPGLQLRVSEEAERNGMDDSELGEFTFDSVEMQRETVTPPKPKMKKPDTPSFYLGTDLEKRSSFRRIEIRPPPQVKSNRPQAKAFQLLNDERSEGPRSITSFRRSLEMYYPFVTRS